jgi:very-short-patch-repair endonuclease
MIEDGIISTEELTTICKNIIESVNPSVSPESIKEIEDRVGSVQPIKDKATYEKILKNTSDAIIEFGGVFSIFEVQKQSIIEDYESLIATVGDDLETDENSENDFQPISSVETDPSQQSILHAIGEKRNCLIQGPPGTGKSQTLTSVLVNALENHKKTLVVCEKRTALEVLNNAISDLGLGSNCILIKDVQKDRKLVVDSVRDRIENGDYKRYSYNASKDRLSILIKEINHHIEEINEGHSQLDKLIIGDKKWSTIVGEILKQKRENPNCPNISLNDLLLEFSSDEYSEFISMVDKGEMLYKKYGSIEMPIFNTQHFSNFNLYQLEKEIETVIQVYKTDLTAIQGLFLKLKYNYIKDRETVIKSLLDHIFTECNHIVQLIEKKKADLIKLDEINLNFGSFIFSYLLKNQKRELYFLKKEIAKSLKQIETINGRLPLKLRLNLSFSSLQNDFAKLSDVVNQPEQVYSNYLKILEEEFDFIDLSNIEGFTGELLAFIEDCDKLRSLIESEGWLIVKQEYKTLKELVDYLQELILEPEKILSETGIGIMKEYEWYKFYNGLTQEKVNLINELRTSKDWISCFSVNYLNTLLSNFANKDLLLSDEAHQGLGKSLDGFKDEQIKYIKKYWQSRQLNAAGDFELKNPNVIVENIYNKRSSNKFKRQSLRQIVKYDTDFFVDYFPIILTTPEVCSTLFNGMNGYFDLVMFDEASQLKVEDNLPALLKGKQIIIAGDEQQMPPSNYFSKVFEGDVEDEDEIYQEEENKTFDKDGLLLSAESLLEWAAEFNFDKKHLDFHYRSRHPYLIDFSNAAFYSNRLKPLPNKIDYVPIEYCNVNGTFADHQNELEAEMVLSIIDNKIEKDENGEYPSLGIATFNISQRNLILSKIREKISDGRSADFKEKIIALESKGLFVKNLENIQGDERDIIIISTTYGIDKHGKFAQRFGPINHSKGYKLLNVIITRAKYKMFVCTSIPEKNIFDYNSYLITEGNNKKAVFYAYLAYCKAVSERDEILRKEILKSLNNKPISDYKSEKYGQLESPFEEEVYQYLVDSVGEENLLTQMEFGGFRIDLVYDSKIEGVPKIAIECDGAKYHSSREAYVYDLHRQKILENFGFVFHRIWSTNWWRNPKREVEKLIHFINLVSSGGFQTTIQDEKLKSVEKTSDDKELEVTTKEVYLDDVSDILDSNYQVEDTVENFTSSWIREAKYFSSDGKKGYVVIKADQGFLVNYNVPIETWIEFKNAKFKSLGSYYHRNIKNRY